MLVPIREQSVYAYVLVIRIRVHGSVYAYWYQYAYTDYQYAYLYGLLKIRVRVLVDNIFEEPYAQNNGWLWVGSDSLSLPTLTTRHYTYLWYIFYKFLSSSFIFF